MSMPPIGAEVPFSLVDFLGWLKVTWPCSKQQLLEQLPQPVAGIPQGGIGPVHMDALSKIPDRVYQSPSDVEQEYNKLRHPER